MYTIAVFDNNPQYLIENLQRFYGETVLQYPDMYFTVVIKGMDEEKLAQLKQEFIYCDKLNMLRDDGVCMKVFHRQIINKDEEEQFDQEYPTACFIYNHQDKLLE